MAYSIVVISITDVSSFLWKGRNLMQLKRVSTCRDEPGVSNQTKSNKNPIELNRTIAVGLGSITDLFDWIPWG